MSKTGQSIGHPHPVLPPASRALAHPASLIRKYEFPGNFENHRRGALLQTRYDLGKLFTFCFARNPYDRCISWYEYHKSAGFSLYNRLSFEDWIKQGMPHHWKVQNQTDYVKEGLSPLLQYNFVDRCKIDFVGRIENFSRDMQTIIDRLNSICEETGLERRFRYSNLRVHASQRRRPRIEDYYTEETKDFVYSLLKKDFIHFGYER